MCIAELNDIDPEELREESEDWMNAMDRGGLKHVTTCTYTMFASAEVELRKHLTMSHEFNVSQIKEKIVHNEDVDFYSSMVSPTWEDEMTAVLLNMMVDE